MIKSDLKGCTRALTCSALKSLYELTISSTILTTGKSPLCRICGTRNETISHIVSECGKLPLKKHKQRHDKVGKHVYWQFREKLGVNRARYEHEPESVVENENFKILWDFTIQCDHMIEAI